MIYAGRSTISKAADLIELSPLVELTVTVNTLFIFTTEVEPEALSITYYPRTSVAGKAWRWRGAGRRVVVAVVGSIATFVPAVTTLLSVEPTVIITATNTLLHVLVKVKAAVILASKLFPIVREASSTADSEAAFKNSERIISVPAPANLQELGLGRSLKILGEVKVFVFIFGVHVGGIENIVVFRRVEEGVSGDSCGILR